MSPRNRLIIILTFVVGVVLVLTLIFGRSSNRRVETQKKADEKIVLTDYVDRDSKVVFTVRGRIVSEQEHRSIRITVGRGSKEIEVIQGYGNNVIKSQRLDNNADAYKSFVYAINREGFGTLRNTRLTNPSGVCPLSQLYSYRLVDNNDTKFDLWSARCQNVGTTKANGSVIRTLFERQIPEYNKFVSDVRL